MEHEGWKICFNGYLPIDERMQDRLKRVMAEIDKLPDSALSIDSEAHVVTIDYTLVRGWQDEARKRVTTVRAGERIVVCPPWETHEAKDGEIVLEIDPGAVFGSGMHESTRLCLKALEKYMKPGMTSVDFGTGSGILAIASARLGAKKVFAIEADTDAADTARKNVIRNKLDDVIEVFNCEDPLPIGLAPIDIMTANITAELIITKAGVIKDAIKERGVLIASGMTVRNYRGVQEELSNKGFGLIETLMEGEWAAFTAARI